MVISLPVYTTLGKIARKYCENFSQNFSFSPKFVKIANFYEFWRKRQILRKIFSPFFPVQLQTLA